MTGIDRLFRRTSILPLAVLRVAFGAVLLFSTLRFIIRGWVTQFYVTPKMHFPFFGWEWLQPLPANGMYLVYGLMACCAFGICAGLYYRLSVLLFLILFTWCGLLDKTYYLNHYYLISLMLFLLLLVPANAAFSFDVWRKGIPAIDHVPVWTIRLFQFQLAVIYICAGLSKLNADWLIEAMPLRIWLPAKGSLPVIGPLLRWPVTAYVFSWTGALFDLGIVLLLWNKKTRVLGYTLVVIFHGITACLFQIGMFPWLMLTATLIFFPASFYRALLKRPGLKRLGIFRETLVGRRKAPALSGSHGEASPSFLPRRIIVAGLGLWFLIQLLLPFRFLFYPGKLLWTEEGYRFSWRVMLMEKAGSSYFYMKDAEAGTKKQINNREFLSAYQERMMETQPDMIVQYAHKLKYIFQQRGIRQPEIMVESYVTLNGHRSRLLMDSSVDLGSLKASAFGHLTCIKPFVQN